MRILVIKFGGTSVRYAHTNIIEIINDISIQWDKIVIVVSALSQVTNMLLETLNNALENKEYLQLIQNIKKVHLDILTDKTCIDRVNEYLDTYQEICSAVSIIKEITPKTQDRITSYGELMSMITISNILDDNNISHKTISSNDYLKTDNNYTNAIIDFNSTRKLVKSKLLPLIESNNIVLTTGFIGSNNKNDITTLGRGGSDYTASVIGMLLEAEEVWIMSDVNGIMTADPNKVKTARLIENISMLEASELSYFGAKILHPKTIQPLIKNNIKMRVKNTMDVSNPGTLIEKENTSTNREIIALTSINNISLITVEGRGMMGRIGIASRVFDEVSRQNVSIPFITQASSETSICFGIPNKYTGNIINGIKNILEDEIKTSFVQNISEINDVSLITIIGANMNNTPGIAGKIFSLIGNENINIIAISQGSSEISISIVINSKNEERTLNILHSLI